jgi:hypothetical protein
MEAQMLITLLNIILLVHAVSSLVWQEKNVLNWFQPKRYIHGEVKKLLTRDSTLYVYDENQQKWITDIHYQGKKIYDIYYSSKYELIVPQKQLRHTQSGVITDLSSELGSALIVSAAFEGDTLYVIRGHELLVYDIKTGHIIDSIKHDEIFHYDLESSISYRDGAIFVLNGDEIDILPIDGSSPEIVELEGRAVGGYREYQPLMVDSILVTADDYRCYIYNVNTRELRTIVLAREPSRVTSTIREGTELYCARRVGDTCRYEVVNVLNGSVNCIGMTTAEASTGREPSFIIDKVKDTLIVTDGTGGLYSMQISNIVPVWYGRGIYETVATWANGNDERILLMYWGGLYSYSEDTAYRARNNNIVIYSMPEPVMYKDSVVLSEGGVLSIQEYDSSSNKKFIESSIDAYLVARDTILYYRNQKEVFKYDGVGGALLQVGGDDILATSTSFGVWDVIGTLNLYDHDSIVGTEYYLSGYQGSRMVDYQDALGYVVLERYKRIVAVDIQSVSPLWTYDNTSRIVGQFPWKGRNVLVFSDGTILDTGNGQVLGSAPYGIKNATVHRDNCFLFYPDGLVLMGEGWELTDIKTEHGSPAPEMIQIYPNPSSGSVSLSWNSSMTQSAQLRIKDQLGRTVHTQQIPPGITNATWDASGAASGVYFMQILHEKGIETGKVMVR